MARHIAYRGTKIVGIEVPTLVPKRLLAYRTKWLLSNNKIMFNAIVARHVAVAILVFAALRPWNTRRSGFCSLTIRGAPATRARNYYDLSKTS